MMQVSKSTSGSALSFLAPSMEACYRFIVNYVAERLDLPLAFSQGQDYEESHDATFSFICGLPYILHAPPRRNDLFLEAIAAPVLVGERYQNRPIYYSDVIVKQESRFYQFEDLRGASWAYNEPLSQSGYGITRYHLASINETSGYFGKVIEAGFHQKAIRMVAAGKIDAAAIDSQVLAIEFREHPELEAKLRVIEALGPSTIQPIAVSSTVPDELKADIQAILLDLNDDPTAQDHLRFGTIDRFTAVDDNAYDDIRSMLETCERAEFLNLK